MEKIKRIDEDKIIFNGIVWDRNINKFVEMKDEKMGTTLQSIKVNNTYYYPSGLDKRKNKEKNELVSEEL